MHRETDAAAHGDAVHVGHIGLGIGSDEMVELVFEPEICLGFRLTLRTARVQLGKSCHVAAGAEGFGPGTAYDNDVGELGLLPFLGIVSAEAMALPLVEEKSGKRTSNRGMIFLHMDASREFSFLGRLSSMVRTP